MMNEAQIRALQEALQLSPDNHPLRQVLAEALQAQGQHEAALSEYAVLVETGNLPEDKLVSVGMFAAAEGNPALAKTCLEQAVAAGLVDGVAGLNSAIQAQQHELGELQKLFAGPAPGNKDEPTQAPPPEAEETITFGQVGGLDGVKKTIHKMIILPFLKPEIYARYGRRSGGGILLYGPPGCGKTMLAKATAGECELPFLNVRIEEILDPYLGVSEANLHHAFQQARAVAPCTLFVDELDALGYARRNQRGAAGRGLVDQLLQELDAIGADNRAILILGATNAPWDVDDALRRPGRFDRTVFVPPPDEAARHTILALYTQGVPSEKLDHKHLAGESALFSGADLAGWVNLALDHVIDEALDAATGAEPRLRMDHFERAREEIRPTTLDWLSRAQNYVEFANRDKRYDDVAAYLRSREVRRHL